MLIECPEAIRTAMVSPKPRPTPSSAAAIRPFLEAGKTTRKTTCHLVAPSASAALAVFVEDRLQGILSDGAHDGCSHQAQDDPSVQDVESDGTSKTSMISGFMMVSPMKPQTTLGIAASNSTRTLRVSFVLGGANSEM